MQTLIELLLETKEDDLLEIFEEAQDEFDEFDDIVEFLVSRIEEKV